MDENETTEDVEMDEIETEETTEEEVESEESSETPDEETEETEESDETEEEETEEDEVDGNKKSKDEGKTEDLEKPVFTKIKQEYPDLFKKHPELRHAFFREQEFSKLFPTVDDAREAAQSAQNFEFVNDELTAGRTENILVSLHEANPESFNKVVTNFLPSLYRLSPDVFLQVTEPVIEHALKGMFKEGNERGNKNLVLAAQHARKFLFGDHNFKEHEAPKVDPEKEQLIQERDTFQQRSVQAYEAEIGSVIGKTMKDEILKGLDPENKLTEFTRNKIVDEVMSQVGSALQNNPEHMNVMNGLWNKAFKSGLNPAFKARIFEAYTSRARNLMPSIRAKVKAAAMGIKTDPTKKTKTIKRLTGGGTPSGPSKTKLDPKKIDWTQTSDLDVLNGTTKFKK